MHIECKIQRAGGTHVDMGDAQYHFAPQPDGAHVALVESERHQDRFLSISEGYRLYRGEHQPAPVAATASEIGLTKAPDAEGVMEGAKTDFSDILNGSDSHPASFDINGKTYSLGNVVAMAAKSNGLAAAEWNELSAEGRADMIDEELDKLNEAGPAAIGAAAGGVDAVAAAATDGAAASINDDAVRAALVVQFEAKFGKKPHYAIGIEKLRQKLAE